MNKGDIIQITDEGHPWYPSLLIIDEVKSWGVQAYILIPQSNKDGGNGMAAYNRLNINQFEVVGEAAITVGDSE